FQAAGTRSIAPNQVGGANSVSDHAAYGGKEKRVGISLSVILTPPCHPVKRKGAFTGAKGGIDRMIAFLQPTRDAAPCSWVARFDSTPAGLTPAGPSRFRETNVSPERESRGTLSNRTGGPAG